MWIKIMAMFLVVITVLLTLAHSAFTMDKTETVHLNLNSVNRLLMSLTNVTQYANKTIVKRSAPAAPGLPFAVVQGSHSDGPEIADSIQLYLFKYPMLKAAHIGTQTFSCRQDTHQLVVAERVVGTNRLIIRMKNDEYVLHPNPGLWWFIRCIGMETGGAGLDVTGVQKPGGDSGIDPNALKSLVG